MVRRDYTGQKFNKLTGIRFAELRNKRVFWEFKCDCGNNKIINASSVAAGCTKSCGCLDFKKAIKDYTNNTYHRLTAVKFIERKNAQTLWEFKCKCGETKKANIFNVTRGLTKSCGCLQKETAPNKTHGGTGTRLHDIWRGMKMRCYNPNVKRYNRYGGRGVTICSEWRNDFAVFRDWALANGYTDELTIDRRDNDGNYEPENCKWSTWKEQANNKGNNHPIAHKGITLNVGQWSEKYKIPCGSLLNRLRRGLSMEKALAPYI